MPLLIVVVAIEGHRSRNRSRASSLADGEKLELLGLGNSSYCEVAIHLGSVGTCFDDMRGLEGDVRVFFDIEKNPFNRLSPLQSNGSLATQQFRIKTAFVSRQVPVAISITCSRVPASLL